MAIVYQATNTVNGKRYIGVTSESLAQRMAKHKSDAKRRANNMTMGKAIRKYGFDAFSFKPLIVCQTYEDALDYEIKLIEIYAPEYNVSKGGGGLLGYRHTEDARQRMSEALCGRPGYWRGKKLPQHVVELKRERHSDPKVKEEWARIRAMGPSTTPRDIICVNDGRVFKSLSEAAKAVGLSRIVVGEICKGRMESSHGWRFRYGDERPRKKIRCVDDGKIYRTTTEAGAAYGVCPSQICAVCNKRKSRYSAGGLVFEFVEDQS